MSATSAQSSARRALIAAALAALLSAGLLRSYMHRFEVEAAGGPKREVLVLVRDLDPGSVLERDALSTRAVPEAYLDSRHVAARELERMLGLRLSVPGRAGEALLWTDLASLRRGAPRLSSLVPAGMRAMTLSTRGGGEARLEPGDRVDVLATRTTREESGATPRTEVAALGVLVLAVGEGAASDAASRDAARRGPVTVAVTPEQGRALAEAELSGALRIVVRNPDELTLDADAEPSSARLTLGAEASPEEE